LESSAKSLTGNLNILYGLKYLSDDWKPVENQSEIGIMFDIKHKKFPVSLAFDYFFSKDEASGDISGETSEFDLGIRYYDDQLFKRARPYFGGGIAYLTAKADNIPAIVIEEEKGIPVEKTVTVSDNAGSVGAYINGGLRYTIFKYLNIGIDLRWSSTTVNLSGEYLDTGKAYLPGIDFEVGGLHTLVFLGFHF